MAYSGSRPPGIGPFLRGDCNNDGVVEGSPRDAIVFFGHCFRNDPQELECLAACDANMDGSVCGSVSDGVAILTRNFRGGDPLMPPFPDPGTSDDPGDVALGCETPLQP